MPGPYNRERSRVECDERMYKCIYNFPSRRGEGQSLENRRRGSLLHQDRPSPSPPCVVPSSDVDAPLGWSPDSLPGDNLRGDQSGGGGRTSLSRSGAVYLIHKEGGLDAST